MGKGPSSSSIATPSSYKVADDVSEWPLGLGACGLGACGLSACELGACGLGACGLGARGLGARNGSANASWGGENENTYDW